MGATDNKTVNLAGLDTIENSIVLEGPKTRQSDGPSDFEKVLANLGNAGRVTGSVAGPVLAETLQSKSGSVTLAALSGLSNLPPTYSGTPYGSSYGTPFGFSPTGFRSVAYNATGPSGNEATDIQNSLGQMYSQQLQLVEIQALLGHQNQTVNLLSNTEKSNHEARMAVIRNVATA